jgi:hypothetical protein
VIERLHSGIIVIERLHSGIISVEVNTTVLLTVLKSR